MIEQGEAAQAAVAGAIKVEPAEGSK